MLQINVFGFRFELPQNIFILLFLFLQNIILNSGLNLIQNKSYLFNF